MRGATPTTAGLPPGIPYSVSPTNGGNSDVSTHDTIAKMIEVVKTNVSLPIVQETAHNLLLSSGGGTEDQLRTIFAWVKAHMRFRTDEDTLAEYMGLPPDKELLFTPHFILTKGWNYGDCDDYSVLAATLIVAARIPVDVYFVTVCADASEPNRWSHVYVAVKCPCGKVVAMDCSHGAYMGWETSKALKKKYWLVNQGSENMSILGMGDTNPLFDTAEATGYYNYDTGGGSSNSNSGIDWGSLLTTSIDQGFGLAKMYISQPQYSQTGPGGSVSYRGGVPVGANLNLSTMSSGSTGTILLIGGLALGAFLLFGRS